MTYSDTLIKRVIVAIKQHRKPSSPKSIAVLMKTMESQILAPKHSIPELKGEIRAALKSDLRLTQFMPQQHTEEELRACLTNFLAALEAPPVVKSEEPEESEDDFEETED